MIVARKGKTIDYVLECERELPEDDQTVFELDAGLSRAATSVIQDSLIGYNPQGEVILARTGAGALTAAKLGIAGIRNLRDEERREIAPKFRTQRAGKGKGVGAFRTLASETLDHLPHWAVMELGGQVIVLNGLEAPEEEGRDPLPGSPETSSSSSSSPPATPPT